MVSGGFFRMRVGAGSLEIANRVLGVVVAVWSHGRLCVGIILRPGFFGWYCRFVAGFLS